MSEKNYVHHAEVLVTALSVANHMPGIEPVALANLSRVRAGTDANDLIAVVVYPGLPYAAIASVTDLEGNPVWVNPANEGASSAKYLALGLLAHEAQRDNIQAYEGTASR